MIQYYACVRLLLFPQLFSAAPVTSLSSTPTHYLRPCAVACAGLCNSYKRLHDLSSSICYSPIATQNLMLAGLALIYSLWRVPNVIPARSAREAVTSCSIMLYVITERWPAAGRYCRAFETVRNTVFDRVMEEGEGTRFTAPAKQAGGVVDNEALDYIGQEFGANRRTGVYNVISDLGLLKRENADLRQHQTHQEDVDPGAVDTTLVDFLLPGDDANDDVIMSPDWRSLVPSADDGN